MKKILRTQLLARLEQEYADYLDELHGIDIDTVISSSDKTNFYANMLVYIREHALFENQLKTLLGYEKSLEKIYGHGRFSNHVIRRNFIEYKKFYLQRTARR